MIQLYFAFAYHTTTVFSSLSAHKKLLSFRLPMAISQNSLSNPVVLGPLARSCSFKAANCQVDHEMMSFDPTPSGWTPTLKIDYRMK